VIPRRSFIKKAAIGSVALLGLQHTRGFTSTYDTSALFALSNKLVERWGQSLLKCQITDKSSSDYGGMLCPSYKIVHGRVGDTIYPFFYLAKKTRDSKYIDAAMLLYRWMEQHVSQPDGSWLNEPMKDSWKGTTVFSIIALCEAIKFHGDLMPPSFKKELQERLKKAGDYIFNTFTIEYGNINYPITAAYALSLLGRLISEDKFIERGRSFAHQAMAFITNDGFVYGEGDHQVSNKGCFAIDLGYNVEESLPSLVLYGLLTKDEEVLQHVSRSLQTHAEFMLPDGGWDNSWGTRNYKWTYWGSRTSDGCQPAYALMADRDPVFYKVALRNTQLLEQCTKDGLLYGGLHYASHGIAPSIHHTFCHIKALTTILDHGVAEIKVNENTIRLPRELTPRVKFFHDNQTWLIAKGRFRATVTGYDKEYKKTNNGHASGGALTMLWHEKTGPLLTASMNQYQLYEAGNMQVDDDPLSMCLTPRIELIIDDVTYMSISDLKATVDVEEKADVVVKIRSRLVDKDQRSPVTGEVNCEITYVFRDDGVSLHFKCDPYPDEQKIKIVFPMISKSSEKTEMRDDHTVQIFKDAAIVTVAADKAITQLPVTHSRVFNFVPGLEALPLSIQHSDAVIEISVI
jgi:hypothetical protein